MVSAALSSTLKVKDMVIVTASNPFTDNLVLLLMDNKLVILASLSMSKMYVPVLSLIYETAADMLFAVTEII